MTDAPPIRDRPANASPSHRSSRLAPRGSALRLAKLAFGVAVAVAIIYALITQWGTLRTAAAQAHPQWGFIALSCAIVLITYALLIEAWRALLGAWEGRTRGVGEGMEESGRIGFWDSARIWSISNLGRYLPGKVWQIGTLAIMVQPHGISSIAAVGSAILVTLITTVAGFVVVAASGASVLHVPPLGTIAIAAAGAAILLAPRLLPILARTASALTGREIRVPRLPYRAIWRTGLIAALSWLLYGIAFEALTRGVLGRAPGAPGLYIAVFTGSYLAGFLALIVPGGVGVREVIMATALERAGFGIGEAILVVIASRLWLTILEIVPALVFLSHHWVRHRRSDQRSNGSVEISP